MHGTIPIVCNGMGHTEYQAFWLGDGRWCVHDMLNGLSEVRDLSRSGTWMIPSPFQLEVSFPDAPSRPTMPGKII
ncbi:MAG: hypothetical protein EOM20_13760 [Spartobacteria bacterium]|nr:hypothetical protein [Spartobacteria bacterium]